MENTADRVAQWLAAEAAARPLYGEDHRHACEVGAVVAMDYERRAEYLAAVLKRRGLDAQLRLAHDVTAALNAGVRRRARRDADDLVSALGLEAAAAPGLDQAGPDPAAGRRLDLAAS